MRIISKFHDYYDTAMAFGQDKTVVYVRNEDFVDITENWAKDMPRIYVENIYGARNELAPRYKLYFCGKVYPFYGTVVYTDNNINTKEIFSFEKNFASHVQRQIPAWIWTNDGNVPWEQYLQENTGKESSVNVDMNCPVVLFEMNDRGPQLTKNPILGSYNIQKIIDPYAAFQELSMFVGGVLTNNYDPPAPQTSKQKVISHGHDPVYGFRKRPRV